MSAARVSGAARAAGAGRPEAMIFDLDGTLIDTLADIAAAVNESFGAAGLGPVGVPEVKPRVGWGMRNLVASLLPEPGPPDSVIDSLAAATTAAYARSPVLRTRAYPGIEEVLAGLESRGIPAAVLSNKPDELVASILGIVFPGRAFALARGQRAAFKPKPDPAQCLDMLAGLGVAPSRALYSGDSAVDVQTARAAGIPVIACLWGFRPAEELRALGPDFIAERPLDILAIVDRSSGRHA